jgi:hypothetical protein
LRHSPRWLGFSPFHQSSSPGVISHCPEDWLRTGLGAKIINRCHPLPTPKKPRRHTVDGTTSTRLRTHEGETASECVASASVTESGAMQRCEAIDLGAGRTCGVSARAVGHAEMRLARRQIMRRCGSRERLEIDHAATKIRSSKGRPVRAACGRGRLIVAKPGCAKCRVLCYDHDR